MRTIVETMWLVIVDVSAGLADRSVSKKSRTSASKIIRSLRVTFQCRPDIRGMLKRTLTHGIAADRVTDDVEKDQRDDGERNGIDHGLPPVVGAQSIIAH